MIWDETKLLAIDMKQCRDCGCIKSKEEFIKNKLFSDGIDTLCLVCNRVRVKKWRTVNPEKRKAQEKRESDPNKEYNRRKHLKNVYGISLEDYDLLYLKQDGCCAICGIHQSSIKQRFHLDHCHTTGKIRGLLCQHCNHLLGRARDTRRILQSAIDYLDKTETGY